MLATKQLLCCYLAAALRISCTAAYWITVRLAVCEPLTQARDRPRPVPAPHNATKGLRVLQQSEAQQVLRMPLLSMHEPGAATNEHEWAMQ